MASRGEKLSTCCCCEATLSKGADRPEGRWIRFGDRYCSGCRWLMSREAVELGVDPGCCPTHGDDPDPAAEPRPLIIDHV